MARSNGFSYCRLIVKNLHTFQNTKFLKNTTAPCETRRAFCDISGINQEHPPPPPSSTSTSNWGKWTAGLMVTIIIPLVQFKEEVDAAMKTTEELINVVEVVAEAVDMVAEKIDDNLLEGSKLKTVVDLVEEVAEEVVEKAQKAVEFIDEVQAAEKKLGPIIEPVKELTRVGPPEAN